MARTSSALPLPSTDAAPTSARHSRVRARTRTRFEPTGLAAAPEVTLTESSPEPAAHRCAVCGTRESVRLHGSPRGVSAALCDQVKCRRRHEASRLVWLNEAITMLAPVFDDELPGQLARGDRSIARCGTSSSR